jgi:hypothetical protein
MKGQLAAVERHVADIDDETEYQRFDYPLEIGLCSAGCQCLNDVGRRKSGEEDEKDL